MALQKCNGTHVDSKFSFRAKTFKTFCQNFHRAHGASKFSWRAWRVKIFMARMARQNFHGAHGAQVFMNGAHAAQSTSGAHGALARNFYWMARIARNFRHGALFTELHLQRMHFATKPDKCGAFGAVERFWRLNLRFLAWSDHFNAKGKTFLESSGNLRK